MAVTTGSNISALKTQRALGSVNQSLQRTFERLSSGLRINRASDDPAGLSIASLLNTDSRIYTQAIRNANDGISTLSIAEGALEQLSNILQRVNELAEQAANGTLGLTQRQALDQEAKQLTDEYNRIIATTSFNGRKLLDGSYQSVGLQLGIGQIASLSISLGDELSQNVVSSSLGNASTVFISPGSTVITSADFNNDGDMDFVYNISGVSAGIYFNNGSGGFTAGPTFEEIAGSDINSGAAAADFNGDGNTDILYTNGTSVKLLAGNGNGTFQAATTIESTYGSGPSIGDFNNDGVLDFAAFSGANIGVYLGSGNGTFTFQGEVASSGALSRIRVADFNGDGRDDVVGQSGTSISVHLANGSGALDAAVTSTVSGPLSDIQVGDLNHDGRADLVTGLANALNVFMMNSDGTLQSGTTYAAAGGTQKMRLADFNGDGELDILEAGSGVAGRIRLFQNNGDGTFTSAIDRTGANNGSLVVDDFNGDGVEDVLLVRTTTGTVATHFSDTTQSANIQRFNLMTQAQAQNALDLVRSALARVATEVGNVGAAQSRLEVSARSLGVAAEEFTSAESRIMSADVAQEAADLTRTQIIQQSASAILAQANVLPALALQLLRDE